jgi:probable rRNA maturation factor
MGIQVEVCVQDCLGPSEKTVSDATYDATAGSQRISISLMGDLLPYAITVEMWQAWFQRWLEELQPTLSPIQEYELSLRLTGDRDIQTLNAQYRFQDQPTDVLAFAALETDSPQPDEVRSCQPLYLGDIIISVETAHKQAQTQGHSLDIELAWLASHGLLHLLGWDHPDDQRLTQMLTQQQFLLSTVGLSVGDS